MSKQSIIVLLVGLNLILLATLILFTYSPPAAMAQAAPLGGGRQAVQAIGIADPRGQGKGAVNRAAAQDRLARQTRKPDRQQTTNHPNPRATRPEFPFCS